MTRTVRQLLESTCGLPFEGSPAEQNAIDVYEAGLNGVPVYGSLEEALVDWKSEHTQVENDDMPPMLQEGPFERRQRLLRWANDSERYLAEHGSKWSAAVVARWEANIADMRERATKVAA